MFATLFARANVTSEHWCVAGDGTLLTRGVQGPGSIWVVTITVAPAGSYEWERYLGWLSPEERAKTERFRREEDRWSYAASHTLRRLMIGQCTGVAPLEIDYTVDVAGRPMLMTQPSEAPSVQFSTSHTVRGVACALSRGADVGADIEWMDPRLTVADFDGILAPAELADSGRTPAANVRDRLFQCWTLKEAYLKAAGVGLSVEPRSFAMGVSPPRILSPPVALRASGRWALASWSPSSEHVASLALRVA